MESEEQGIASASVQAQAEALMAEVRRHLNGVVAASLRREGFDYPFCLGVSIATLREIGGKYGPNQPLARYLLARTMRESLLLASIVADPARHEKRDTELWENTFGYSECIDVACADYFWKLPDALLLALDWLFSDDLKMQRAGITLLANVYRKSAEEVALPSNCSQENLFNRIVELTAEDALFQPLLFLFRWLAACVDCTLLLTLLCSESLPDSSYAARQQLVEYLGYELKQ